MDSNKSLIRIQENLAPSGDESGDSEDHIDSWQPQRPELFVDFDESLHSRRSSYCSNVLRCETQTVLSNTSVQLNIPVLPDINAYQQRKTLAQGMMDIALLSANANQLRYVLESKENPYFYPSVIFIGASIVLQIAIGVGLAFNCKYDRKVGGQVCKANKINDWILIGIFLVTVINVFIAAFGAADSL